MTTNFDAALFHELKSDSAIAAKVGTRIRPLTLKQNETLPAISYQQVGGGIHPHTHGDPAVFHKVKYQLNCWAVKYDDAMALARDVINLLDGKSGEWGTSPNTAEVWASLLADERNEPEPANELSCRQVDFTFCYI